jgi:energy-converting hydrogenase A subunit R
MDKYQISSKEKKRVKELGNEIASLPIIKIPKNANSIIEFSPQDQQTVTKLNEIFWKEIPKMDVGRMLNEINPIGGTEKARAVKDILRKTGSSFDKVMYIGDSITDVPALKLVREKGGLAISFNGNKYSVRESDIAVLSGNTIVTSILAEVFNRRGKKEVLKLVNDWSFSGVEKYCPVLELLERINTLFPYSFPQVEQVTADNMERLVIESSVFRKTVRGEAIGKLG